MCTLSCCVLYYFTFTCFCVFFCYLYIITRICNMQLLFKDFSFFLYSFQKTLFIFVHFLYFLAIYIEFPASIRTLLARSIIQKTLLTQKDHTTKKFSLLMIWSLIYFVINSVISYTLSVPDFYILLSAADQLFCIFFSVLCCTDPYHFF